MQALLVQLHPEPVIDVSVKPFGSVSVTVTVPLVAPAPDAFDTVTVYDPLCPCVKLPLCVDATLSTAVVGAGAVQLPMVCHPLLALDPAANM